MVTKQLKYNTGVIYRIPINDRDIKIIDGEEYVKVKGLLDRLIIEKKWTNVMKDSLQPQRVRKKLIKNEGVSIGEEMSIE